MASPLRVVRWGLVVGRQRTSVGLCSCMSDKYVRNGDVMSAGVVSLTALVTALCLKVQRHFIPGQTAGSLR